jgi:hypothetical protein
VCPNVCRAIAEIPEGRTVLRMTDTRLLYLNTRQHKHICGGIE